MSTSADSSASSAVKAGSGPVWVLGLAAAAQFVLQLDFSIINVALPAVQHELHFNAAALQWVVTGYALTFGALLLVADGPGICSVIAGRCSPAWPSSASPRCRAGWP